MNEAQPPGWFRRLVQGIMHEDYDDPLPREWVWIALLLSLSAVWVGLRTSASDFTLNILANLALLGPGLILTNVIAANWRQRRRSSALGAAIQGFCSEIDSLLASYALDLQRITGEAPPENDAGGMAAPLTSGGLEELERVNRYMGELADWAGQVSLRMEMASRGEGTLGPAELLTSPLPESPDRVEWALVHFRGIANIHQVDVAVRNFRRDVKLAYFQYTDDTQEGRLYVRALTNLDLGALQVSEAYFPIQALVDVYVLALRRMRVITACLKEDLTQG